MYLLLYCKGSKRVTQGFTVRRSWRPNKDCNILTPTLMAISVVSFSFSRAAQPEAQGPSSLLDDGFLYCILSPTGLQKPSGVPRAPSAGCGFPYHILSPTSLIPIHQGPKGPLRQAFSTTSYQQLLWSPTHWLPVFTELYDSSTPTQSPTQLPTQSLEWHVWSSSSRNNCHAVRRSLSSGASVYECTMGFFTLSHFVSQARLHDFLS